MSATVKDDKSLSAPQPPVATEASGTETVATPAPKGGNYKGFVAGVFSGIAKLSVGCVDEEKVHHISCPG